jgi:regulator of nonsense transcripts 3
VIDEYAVVIDEYPVHGIEGSISGIPLTSADSGKKKILLLKGKQREIPKVG